MTVRTAALAMTFLVAGLAAGLLAGCSKTEEAKTAAPAQVAAEPAQMQSAPMPAEPPLVQSAPAAVEPPPVENMPAAEAEAAPVPPAFDPEMEMRAAAAEVRARLAEAELQIRTRQDLERQQLAAQAEAERAAMLAAENAALRARAYEAERRAVEAERAAYGNFGGANVIIVQPPQRPRPRPPHQYPPQQEPPPKSAGVSFGLRPAVPDLTPPGPPATFGGPKFDTMRAVKPRDAETPG